MQCNVKLLIDFIKDFSAEQQDDKIPKEKVFKAIPIIRKRDIAKIVSNLNEQMPVRDAISLIISSYKFNQVVIEQIIQSTDDVKFTRQAGFAFCLQLLAAIYSPSVIIDHNTFILFFNEFEYIPSINYSIFFASELIYNIIETPEFEWSNGCITLICSYIVGHPILGHDDRFSKVFEALVTKMHCLQQYDLCLTLTSSLYRMYCEDFPLASRVDQHQIIEFVSYMMNDLSMQALKIFEIIMKKNNFQVIPVVLHELADIFSTKINICEVSISITKYSQMLKANIEEANYIQGIPSPPKLLVEEFPIDFLKSDIIELYNLILPIFQLDNKFDDTLFLALLSNMRDYGEHSPHLFDFIEFLIKLLEIRPDYKLLMAFYNSIADKALFNPNRTIFSEISLVVLSYRRKFLDLIANCESKVFPGILKMKDKNYLLFTEIVGYITTHRETINLKLFENELVIEAATNVAKNITDNLYAFSVLLDFALSLIARTKSIFFPKIVNLIDIFMNNHNYYRYIMPVIFNKLSKIDNSKSIRHISEYFIGLYQKKFEQNLILNYFSDLIHCNPQLSHQLTKLIKDFAEFPPESAEYVLRFMQVMDKDTIDPQILLQIGNSIRKVPNYVNNQMIFQKILSIIAKNHYLNKETKYIIERPYFIILLFIVYGDTPKMKEIFKIFQVLIDYLFENLKRLQIGNVDYFILCCLRNNFKITNVPIEGIDFPVLITRELYEDIAKNIFEQISVFQSNAMVIGEFALIFKKVNLEIAPEAANLLLNTLSRSIVFIKEYFPLEYNDYSKVIDDYQIDFNKICYFDIYISINDYVAAETGTLLNIITIKDDYNNSFRLILHDSKIFARMTAGNMNAIVTLYTTYQWQGDKYLGIKYQPKDDKMAQFFTWFDDREFGEASFFIPQFKGKKKLCFGGGAGQQEHFHLTQGICGKIIINNDTFTFDSKTFNLSLCASRFDLHNSITNYFAYVSQTPLELDMLILGIIHKIFVSNPESQKTFQCVFEIFQRLVAAPKKLCYKIFKVLLAIYQDITFPKLKKNWFKRLVFNFTLWAKCDCQSFCFIVTTMTSLLKEDSLYKEMIYYNFSFFSECLLYYRLIFNRTNKDKFHAHEVKLGNVTNPEDRAKCNHVMLDFIKNLGKYSLSIDDIDILLSLVHDAEDPDIFLGIIRDLAPNILTLMPDFPNKFIYFKPQDKKSTIILYCQVLHALKHPKLHIIYMMLAQKINNFNFVEELLADMIENIQIYPNTFSFILSINRLQDNVLPVIFSLFNSKDIVKNISFDGIWYLPIVQQCLNAHYMLIHDSFYLILDLINQHEDPTTNFMILFNIVFLFQEKSLCDEKLLLTFLKAAKKVKFWNFTDELFICSVFGLLFSMNYSILRKDIALYYNNHYGLSRDSSDVSTFDSMITLFNNFSVTNLYNSYELSQDIKDLCFSYYNELKSPSQFQRDVKDMIEKIFNSKLVQNTQQFEEITKIHDILKSKFLDSMGVTKNHLSLEIFLENQSGFEEIHKQKSFAQKVLDNFTSLIERSYSRPLDFPPRFIKDRHLYNQIPIIFKMKRPKKPDNFNIIDKPFDLTVNQCLRISLFSKKDASVKLQNNNLIYTTKKKEQVIKFDKIKYTRKVSKDIEILFDDGNTFLLSFDDKNVQNMIYNAFKHPAFEFNNTETSFNVILNLNEKVFGRSFNSQSFYPFFPRFICTIEDLSMLHDFSNCTDLSETPQISRAIGKKLNRLEKELEKGDFILSDFLFNFDSIFADDHIPKNCKDKYEFIYQMRRVLETDEFRQILMKWIFNLKCEFKVKKVKSDDFNFPSNSNKLKFQIPVSNPDFVAAFPQNDFFFIFIAKETSLFQFILSPKNFQQLKKVKTYQIEEMTFQKEKNSLIGLTNVGTPNIYNFDGLTEKELNRCLSYRCSSNNEEFYYVETGFEVIMDSLECIFKVNENIVDYFISDVYMIMAVVTNSSLYLFNIRRKRQIFKISLKYQPTKVMISDGFSFLAVSSKNKSYFYSQVGQVIREYDYPFDSLVTVCGFDFFTTIDEKSFVLTDIITGEKKIIEENDILDVAFNSETRVALISTNQSLILYNCPEIIPISKLEKH
ncbi:hypothetical protein TVAG_002970 [Trichomonas vaginalis G3]|uniref:Uncharacterized protein n=1 Tax=Trichomonas vaginalis (strain ATCC PRA-98 / G3) TaxID=412133 RepID=A2EZS0_TRIV3|nr:BEACH domain-containing protein family [Trichomonas vaginalis G3]EAY01842.1 hypothetical protein TVAG_002970 [Trichomonas vaginalis G3]KAI5497568.1 BEACH domain-containing protein family [Trichomonas vaginalis G3]|eukprot:XP_001314389.1 hypothetical protein [Trichomonas vaginalis G3]